MSREKEAYRDNLELIMEEWLETAKALGRPIPEAKGKLFYA